MNLITNHSAPVRTRLYDHIECGARNCSRLGLAAKAWDKQMRVPRPGAKGAGSFDQHPTAWPAVARFSVATKDHTDHPQRS